jgi:multidrug efflux pump subunit AcrB
MAGERRSFSSRIVDKFLDGNLSVILIALAFLAGFAALTLTPREEEPQIEVPLADVFVHVPGADAEEVEKLVTSRLEKLLWQVEGVEYVYSMSRADMAVVTVRFHVGEEYIPSLVKLHDKIRSNIDQVPSGVAGWVVKPVSVDDVPIVNLTLYSETFSDHDLRRVGEEVRERLQSVKDTNVTTLIGGRPRQIRVELHPQALSARSLAVRDVVRALEGGNLELPAGSFQRANAEVLVRGGAFLRSARDVGQLVVGVHAGAPVFLRDVAEVNDGMAEADSYTRLRFGPAADSGEGSRETEFQAVNIAVAKKKGTNAVTVAEDVIERVMGMRGTIIPDAVEVRVTRNYGETADHKVNELIMHLTVAVITVLLLILFSLGWREALIVAVAIPIIYSLTLLVNYWFGFTINRVTLFALVLSLGLLVDDPIVDVENIYRHFKLRREKPRDAVLTAVDEVRPPIILATVAVIISFLPMMFITGMMGPYMMPMAVNVPLTMAMSLLVAFTVTPWMTYHVLKGEYDKPQKKEEGETRLQRFYRKLLLLFLESRRKSWMLVAAVVVLLVVSMLLPVFNLVPLKMLPFDNKNEFQLMVDMPEGTTLEETDAAVRALEDYLSTVNEVTDFESYVGLASAMDFNGMVRHYYLREGPNAADIRVNLLPKADRSMRSHEITLRLRDELTRIAEARGANLKIVESPPGPPVIATLVGEVYAEPGVPYEDQVAAARIVRQRMESEDRVVDVDDMVEAPQERWHFIPEREKAALSGITDSDIARTLAVALEGQKVGAVHIPSERNPLDILVRLPRAGRSSLEDLQGLSVRGEAGSAVRLSELGSFERETLPPTIYHKNLERVSYVMGDVAGKSPVNAVLNLSSHFKEHPLPTGNSVVWSGEGEWQITIDVFRDLGIAFGAALVGIYILLVLETASFAMPLIIMGAIPLTMIGIMPGFWILNLFMNDPVGGYDTPVFFTATAMIGMIALAGIVVRNSIILIDFIHSSLKKGMPLKEAILESGAVRFRPILLTAGSALLGNWVITLDPIFSGLAWSIIFGVFASTAFTLVVIPVVYWLIYGKKAEQHARRFQS